MYQWKVTLSILSTKDLNPQHLPFMNHSTFYIITCVYTITQIKSFIKKAYLYKIAIIYLLKILTTLRFNLLIVLFMNLYFLKYHKDCIFLFHRIKVKFVFGCNFYPSLHYNGGFRLSFNLHKH
jgi:hypothetical protein